MSAASPMQIGITGGIGAGKSLVCRLFELLKVPVYDADAHAKRLMQHDKGLVHAILRLMGEQAYFKDYTLNTPYMAACIFQDPQLRKALEALVHPALEKHYVSWARVQPTPYVLKEAALLFESGSYRHLDAIIFVSAPVALRTRRVLARDPTRHAHEVRRIMRQQWSTQKKQALSTYTIKNHERQALIPQVLRLHEGFLQTALHHHTAQAT